LLRVANTILVIGNQLKSWTYERLSAGKDLIENWRNVESWMKLWRNLKVEEWLINEWMKVKVKVKIEWLEVKMSEA
jgi:hypothetical protein